MAKNIILCSDGTGNSTIKNRGTNVYKLYEAIDLEPPPPEPHERVQIGFYGDGVGTGGLRVLRVLGGAFGYGFARNVKDLYKDLCRVYDAGDAETGDPPDSIFLFGFSRGAYTVRALAGLINVCGILKGGEMPEPELRKAVAKAYRVYRRRFWPERFHADAERRAAAFRREYGVHEPGTPVRIAFIGVWDTVGAVGLPDDAWTKRILWAVTLFRVPWFKHYRLGAIIDRACHALSIDDERQTFHPILWEEPAAPALAPDGRGPRLEQVWFPGVHANVGGGYVKHGMSLVTLCWMMRKAERAGLRFSKADRRLYFERQNVYDKLYDSRSGLAFSYRYSPRDIAAIASKAGIAAPHVHIAAFDRIGMRTEGYAPGNIPGNTVVVADDPNEDPKRVERTQAAVARALEAAPPLAAASTLKRVRQLGYFTAIGCALAAALAAVLVGLAGPGLAATAADLVSVSGLVGLIWDALKASPGWMAALLAGFASGVIASWLGRRAMQDRFAEVWRPVAAVLRPIR